MVVDGFDVVAHLAAHQSNLTPGEVTHRAAVVALPTPPIVRAVFRDEAARLRGTWMRCWAERLGGGDGPLPLVDFDADERSLGAILRELEQRGCERLFVLGARDQPGFARELTCRWPGELHVDLAPLAPDLRCDLAATLDDPRGVVAVAVSDEGDPHATATNAVAYARDPDRAAGPWHGFVPPAALYGTETGNRVRELWQRYWAARGWPDAVRQAVLGLDAELDRRLAEPIAPTPPAAHARIFAVTGVDGAGKSTHAAALHAALEAAGWRSCVLKLYRQGAFLALADELSGRTRRGAPLAAFRVSRIVKLVDSLRVYRDQLGPALERLDAVVLDRYTETHRAAAGAQLGWDLVRHPMLALFPPADRAFWLELDANEAVRRLRARGGRLSADEHPVGLAGYAAAFSAIATTPDDVILHATSSATDNAARIAREALAIAKPLALAKPDSQSPPPAAVAAETPAASDCRSPLAAGSAAVKEPFSAARSRRSPRCCAHESAAPPMA